MVSRHHATLLRVTTPETASYLFRLIDGNLQGKRSTNGILVNNQRCFSYNLKHGDVIVFGSDVKARYYTSANQADVEFLTSGEVEDMSGFLSNLSNPFQTFVGSDKELEQFNEAALVRLASFPELISHPILEINLAGSITYLNPAAVLQFPDIREAGLAHPMLAGLLSKVQQDKKNYLVREVAVGQQVFEQSVHYIAQSDLIRCYVSDITERKRAEEALRGSEAKNRALLNAIPDLMLRIRQDGTYLDYMPAKGIDLLAAGNDLVGKNEYEVLPPAVATARMNHVERALQTSETQVFEYQLPRNGSIRHEEARIVVSGENEVLVIVRDITKRKQVEAALQQAHDELELRVAQRTAELSKANEQLRKEITERQWAEEAMRQSEERLKAVLDNSTALIYVKDTQGRYLLINHWYARLFHLDQEAIRGKTDYDIFPKELADVYQANDQSVLKAGRSLEYEEVAPQDDGLHTYLSIKFPLYDTAGVPSAVCGISTDITQRKQTEAALRSSVATNRALLNAIPDLMVRISKDGTLVNFKVPKDINLASADQLLGKNLYEVLPLEVARSAAHCVESALETNDIQIFEYQLPQQFQLQGNSATHEKALQWRDYEARVVVSAKDEVLAIVRDITERKQAEEEVRNALEKEKELSELKS
ncbi:MAG TPA: PAS domain-containing protein, partial [Candidatus Caenarcaniphilales bacterium]